MKLSLFTHHGIASIYFSYSSCIWTEKPCKHNCRIVHIDAWQPQFTCISSYWTLWLQITASLTNPMLCGVLVVLLRPSDFFCTSFCYPQAMTLPKYRIGVWEQYHSTQSLKCTWKNPLYSRDRLTTFYICAICKHWCPRSIATKIV